MRAMLLVACLLLGLIQAARANTDWEDGLPAASSPNDPADPQPAIGLICKEKANVVTFLKISFRVVDPSDGTSLIDLTNKAVRDPSACALTEIEFVGEKQEVGRIARKGVVYVIYQVRLSNGAGEFEEHFVDPYPTYRFLFNSQSLQ